jgi:hypothetical protein
MGIIRRLMQKLVVWHWAHKGEAVAHLTYLGATFIEGHGIHALAAGATGLFFMLALFAVEQTNE